MHREIGLSQKAARYAKFSPAMAENFKLQLLGYNEVEIAKIRRVSYRTVRNEIHGRRQGKDRQALGLRQTLEQIPAVRRLRIRIDGHRQWAGPLLVAGLLELRPPRPTRVELPHLVSTLQRLQGLRDPNLENHNGIIKCATLIAKKYGASPRTSHLVEAAAALHDIGKIATPDKILFKKGPLTKKERQIVQQHAVAPLVALNRIRELRPVIPVIEFHHERYNGTGYPNGLKGKAISLAARIVSVADVFTALTQNRSYREAWPKERAIKYIVDHSGSHFDPKVVVAFLQVYKSRV